jgi:hypothetical protein
MEKLPSALLDLLRSRTQGDLLALLFLHPDQEYSLTEAAGLIGATVRVVHTEAGRLIASGLVHDRRRGNLRLIQADTDNFLARPLTDLLVVTYGPLPVLTNVLQGVPGIEHAYIFGSWAARYLGETGPVPNDIDLLIVGDIPLTEMHRLATEAEEQLHREVNPRRVRPDVWENPPENDTFYTFLKQRPLVEIPVNQ